MFGSSLNFAFGYDSGTIGTLVRAVPYYNNRPLIWEEAFPEVASGKERLVSVVFFGCHHFILFPLIARGETVHPNKFPHARVKLILRRGHLAPWLLLTIRRIIMCNDVPQSQCWELRHPFPWGADWLSGKSQEQYHKGKI